MITLNIILPFISAAFMLVCCIVICRRVFTLRGLHLVYWATGLSMFTIASLSEAYLTLGWNQWAFFTWYFFGAALNAAWIGQGTLYLLFSNRRVLPYTMMLIICSLAALILMLQIMPLLNASEFSTQVPISEQYTTIMPPANDGAIIRMATPLFNVYGTIVLVGGALWSSYLFWRKRILPNRVIGNLLIALGTLVMSLASVITRMGLGRWLIPGELLAAGLLFIGFVVATKSRRTAMTSAMETPHKS